MPQYGRNHPTKVAIHACIPLGRIEGTSVAVADMHDIHMYIYRGNVIVAYGEPICIKFFMEYVITSFPLQ